MEDGYLIPSIVLHRIQLINAVCTTDLVYTLGFHWMFSPLAMKGRKSTV